MSSLIVPVARIDDLKAHPNADKLEIAQVLGWQVVVQKGTVAAGDTVTYFPPDTVLPEDVSAKLGVTKYLSKGRVRQVKLRGEPSFGFIGPATGGFEVGANVADLWRATKYEPPVRMSAGDALPEHPLFPTYTDIENMRNFPAIFRDGEPVVVTEKIHGTSVRVGIVDGEQMAGSKRIRRGRPTGPMEQSLYWYPWSLAPVDMMLWSLSRSHRQVVLFGEVYGSKVQSLGYGIQSGVGFRAFDLILDGTYVDWSQFIRTCDMYGVQHVPVLDYMPFNLEHIRELSGGTTELMGIGAHIREGVVVKPLTERHDPAVGRVILKYISDAYLFGSAADADVGEA